MPPPVEIRQIALMARCITMGLACQSRVLAEAVEDGEDAVLPEFGVSTSLVSSISVVPCPHPSRVSASSARTWQSERGSTKVAHESKAGFHWNAFVCSSGISRAWHFFCMRSVVGVVVVGGDGGETAGDGGLETHQPGQSQSSVSPHAVVPSGRHCAYWNPARL